MSAAWAKKRVNILAPEWTDENVIAYRWCINNGIKKTK